MVEHFCVKFGDPSCSGFWDIMQNNRQTDTHKQTNATENHTHTTIIGVGNN